MIRRCRWCRRVACPTLGYLGPDADAVIRGEKDCEDHAPSYAALRYMLDFAEAELAAVIQSAADLRLAVAAMVAAEGLLDVHPEGSNERHLAEVAHERTVHALHTVWAAQPGGSRHDR